MGYQKVVIIGRLGRDPETRTAGTSTVAEFSVAVDHMGANGERVTEWFNCQAWGKTAEFVQKWFHKGDGIIVEGEMRFNSYTAQDGSKRDVARLNARLVDFPPASRTADAAQTARPAKAEKAKFEEIEDDGELPF